MEAVEAVFDDILSGAVSNGNGAEMSGSGIEAAGVGALGLGFGFLRWLMKVRGLNSLLVRVRGRCIGF